MTQLPSCFKPTLECRMILQRVEAGYHIEHEHAELYHRVGFIEPVLHASSGATAYVLTDMGREALNR